MTVSAKREARVELKSSAAGMDAGINDARRKMRGYDRELARASRQRARDAKAARKELLGTGRSVLGTVKDGIGLGLGLEAAGGIAGMAGELLEYEKALTRLQISSNSTPAAMREFSRTVEAASLMTGIGRNEVLSAATAYVALTGDMDTARASTALWAKVAAATGSTVSEIAQTAAAMSQQMGIGPAEMEATFSALAQQGKAGAIELKDLAGTMSQIAPMWAQFKGGRGIQGVRQLGAALQIVKRGFGGDAGETVTGLQSLLVSLQQNAGKFKEAGIKVFDVDKNGKETMKDVFSIVDSISKSKLANHPDLLGKAFGRVEATRAYMQLAQNREELHRLVKEAEDAGLIQRDFNTYMESSSGRLEKSWNAVKLAVAAALTPERVEQMVSGIERMAQAMGPLMTAIGKVADGFSAFIHKVAQAKQWFQGNSHYEPTDEENALLSGLETEKRGQTVYWSGADRARAQQVAARAAAYNQQIDDIMGSESDFGATDDSIRKAILAAKSDMGPDKATTGAGSAGRAYLSARSDEISVPRYKRIEQEIYKSDPWYGGGRSDAAPIDERKLADAMAAALQRVGIGVKIGAEPIAKAAKNAATLKTRPGGRL